MFYPYLSFGTNFVKIHWVWFFCLKNQTKSKSSQTLHSSVGTGLRWEDRLLQSLLGSFAHIILACAQTQLCPDMFGRDFGLFSHCSPLGRYWMGFGRPEKLRAHVLQVTKVSMTTCLAHIEPRLWSWPNFSQIWENLNFCRQSVQKLTDSTQHSESSWNIEIGTMAKQCTLEPWPTELFF